MLSDAILRLQQSVSFLMKIRNQTKSLSSKTCDELRSGLVVAVKKASYVDFYIHLNPQV